MGFVWDYLQEVVTLTNAKVIQILELIICPENLPLYLHCLDGARVTGLVVMCFRKLQCWNLSTSTAEFCRFQREGEISREESQFVETFRGDFNVPAVIPNWLWQGIRTVKHPTFRLHLLPSPFQAEREGEAFTGVNGFLANSNASLQSSSNSSDGQGDCNKRHRMVCSKSEKGLHLLATNCTSVIAGKNILQSASTEDQDSKSKGMNYMKDEDLTNLQREEVHSSGVLLKKPDNQVTCRSKKNATFDSNPGIRNHQIECRKLEMEALSLEGLNLVRWKLQMPPLPKRPNLALCICNDGKVGYLQETNFSWSYLRNCLH
ncbi:hypothetical protein O6H91_11G035900 [Diphasiastrum complanatum]|uniref:Uncharacterized protein n=1 Tax=Diphasiastrum complanatum TaxID=34168 RepID=A0ACC2C865_DIPCM|nr:hypothetical protein O6H91_11G035900 [Diphasiastrum complanatum]